MEFYCHTKPMERGYMQHMWEQRMSRRPTFTLTKKQLVAQCSHKNRRKLLSQLEIERLRQNGNTTEQHGGTRLTPAVETSVKELHDTPPPIMTGASTKLRMKIVARLNTANLRMQLPGWLRKSYRSPIDILVDVNTALLTTEWKPRSRSPANRGAEGLSWEIDLAWKDSQPWLLGWRDRTEKQRPRCPVLQRPIKHVLPAGRE